MSDMTNPLSMNISDISNNNIMTEPSVSNDDDLLLQKHKLIQYKKARNDQFKDELVQVVCRQTELTPDEAKKRLEEAQYNYIKVLNDYFEIKDTKIEKPTTINQQIYGEIRTLMDNGAKRFRFYQDRAQHTQK